MAGVVHRERSGTGASQPCNAAGDKRQRVLRVACVESLRNRSHPGCIARVPERRAGSVRSRCKTEQTPMDDPPGEKRVGEMNLKLDKTRMTIDQKRSAELHSAVSQIFNLLNGKIKWGGETTRSIKGRASSSQNTCTICSSFRNSEFSLFRRFAECNSAIQQIENLRYGRKALLHFQSWGFLHNPAFTGLFNTYLQQRACS